MPATNKNKKSILRFAWYIVFVANIIAIFTLFLATLAWYVPPAKTTFFSYLGLGFVFILVTNIIFLIFWIILLKWKYAAASFITLLICISPILTYFPIHKKSKEIPENTIKILSYNVLNFNMFNKYKGTENPILSYIKDSDADIVCLQEFSSAENTKNRNQKKIDKELKDYPYHSFIQLESVHDAQAHYGLACFSKHPILSTTKLPIDTRNNAGSVMYKIKVKDQIITVFNNHLESNRLTTEDRKLYENLLSSGTDKQRIDSITVNIRKRLGPAYVKRAAQAKLIDLWIKEQGNDKVIVCGDFNDTPISYTYKTIKGRLEDSFVDTGFGAGITYNQNYFLFRIDYILHSSGFDAYNCTVDKIEYSDHYPIWTYLKLE